MALMCSSSHNPLAQFTKHIYNDRESSRDKLVSKRMGIERESFRSSTHSDDRPIANEFAQFNSSFGHFPGPSDTHIERGQLNPAPPSDSEVIAWAAEFKRGDLSHSNARLNVIRQDSKPLYHSNYAKSWPQDRLHQGSQQHVPSYASYSNTSYSRPGFSALRPSVEHHRPEALMSRGQIQSASSDQTLDSMDWETVFQSLEPAIQMREAETQGNVEVKQETVPYQEILQENVLEAIFEKSPPTCPPRLVSNYNFQDENPFTEIPNPFEEGMKIINDDGNLSLAALAFEAACQQDHTHVDAWTMLGTVLSENEKEREAIIALKEALILDSENMDAMMKLSVSYTNEGFENLAYENLEKWLTIKYPGVRGSRGATDTKVLTQTQSLERIKELFLEAAQISIASDAVDSDVQVGLGVLLFSESNYEMAADCFASAIHSFTPGITIEGSQLHLLWNRYGACLGNMGQYAEAIEAYEMALAIRPNFVRARTNLGLLCYNKNDPLMGARHTLKAIQEYGAGKTKAKTDMLKIVRMGKSHGRLEEVNYGTEPTNIYAALKKCCNSMCRWDLAEEVGPNMDLRKFEQELGSP